MWQKIKGLLLSLSVIGLTLLAYVNVASACQGGLYQPELPEVLKK